MVYMAIAGDVLVLSLPPLMSTRVCKFSPEMSPGVSVTGCSASPKIIIALDTLINFT